MNRTAIIVSALFWLILIALMVIKVVVPETSWALIVPAVFTLIIAAYYSSLIEKP
jgi:hypothetical protein